MRVARTANFSQVIQRRKPALMRVLKIFRTQSAQDGGDGGEFYDERRPVKNIRRVGGETRGERRSETGIEDQQAHPAVEKSGARAETFAQVHVGSAGAGETAGELAVSRAHR